MKHMREPITITDRSWYFNSGINYVARRTFAITNHNAEIMIGRRVRNDITDSAPDFNSVNWISVAPKVDEPSVLIEGKRFTSQ